MSEEQKPLEPEITLHKITNPLWIGEIGPEIAAYVKKLEPVSITYESLYASFCGVAQYGGDSAEFWVAMKGDVPVGFAMFSVQPLPFIGAVKCDHIYNFGKDRRVLPLFMEQFKRFSREHNAPNLFAFLTSKALVRHYEKMMPQCGIGMKELDYTIVVGREV